MTAHAAPSPTTTDPAWRPPGPGSWVLDRDHTGPSPSRPVRDLFAAAARRGMGEAFDLLGGPLETMEIEFVNGRFYRRMRPAVGGDSNAAPPAPMLWLGARVHPTFRRRERTARAALAERTWLAELDRWESEWKPTIEARNRELAEQVPAAMDDPALAEHVSALWVHLCDTTVLHFRLHGSDVGPIGLLLARTDELGIDRASVFAALAGASPATTEPSRALDALRAAVRPHLDGTPPRDLEGIRALHSDVADAVDSFVDRYGWRLTTGYDLIDHTLVELPGVLPRAIVSPHDGDADRQALAEDRGHAAGERLLAAVPASQRSSVTTALLDARRCYGLRDENGPITYEWPAGVLRRALLESGRRLTASGRLRAADHVFDATIEETVELLRGGHEPSATELASRNETRRGWAELDAPEALGPPERIPPSWTLPRAMRTLTAATLAVVELLQTERSARLEGTGLGEEPYTGTARVVLDAVDAYERVEPGDVLVTKATAPTFNAVLAVAGAFVVEEGGLLSHAAVIARELGTPAVIGAGDATTAISDGEVVEVDPVRGVVRIVS